MSEIVSRGRGRQVAAGAVVLVLAAGGVAAWRTGVSGPDGTPGAGGASAPPPATATVTRQDLSATTPLTATLGYAGSYTVTGRGGGTLTWLPSAGQVIRQGQALYRVDNGSPVVLLYGSVPAWRPMSTGDTGADVSQLNHDLVRLGYANSADVSALGWDNYSWETEHGVQQLEEHLGVGRPVEPVIVRAARGPTGGKQQLDGGPGSLAKAELAPPIQLATSHQERAWIGGLATHSTLA